MDTPAVLHELKGTPAVFAVKDKYQIMVMARTDLLFWVTIDGVDYADHSNGIIRSSTRVHRVIVPMAALDKAKKYTINYRRIIDRKPYHPLTEPIESQTYDFKPVDPTGEIKMYHLSDTHGRFTEPAKAGTYFGDDIDVLVLNGDVPNHSGDIKNFDLIYELCAEITGGQRPCIFSRGNHDTRGFYAENIADYTPNLNGNSYYTFRLGKLWGIVMDTGEDKPDDHEEYGHTVACHQFRLEETEFLENVVKHPEEEYAAEGVEYRVVIVHNPYSHTIRPPFDIEQPLFKKWLDILEENVKPDLMISGHLHATFVSHAGSEWDNKGQICPVVVGAKEICNENRKVVGFIGCAITFKKEGMLVEFTDSDHNVRGSELIPYGSK